MSAKDPLQRLTVTSPCAQDWDSMIGNSRVRFCEHCSLHVHNISEMTRAEALRLAHRSHGRLCVRYLSTTQNPIGTRTTGSRRLYQIGSRVSRLASGAFSATLSVSAVFAEPASNIHGDNGVFSRVIDQRNFVENSGSITGTVMDPNQAVIPGALAVLTNAQTQSEMTGTTNDAGEFRFDGLDQGYYSLKVTSPGFVTFERTALHVGGAQGVDVQVAMTVEVTSVVVGSLVVMSPSHPFVKAAHDDDINALLALIADTDVNLRDPDSGTTALDHAVRNGNSEMVQLLLSRNVDVNASEEGGYTPLMQLGDDATPDLLWDLINAGAKINHKTSYGNTALMSAVSRNNPYIVKVLLEAGADINAANEDGMTALMMASSDGRVNNVRLLVLAGARIDARDSEGKNALMYAIENEHRSVIRLLRAKGATEVPLKKEKDDEEEN